MVGAAESVVDELVRIESEAGEDGGGEVSGGDGIGVGVGSDLVAGAPSLAPLDPAAGEDDAVAVGPVVASAGGVDARGATEFAHSDDEGTVEEAALVKVFQEGGVGLIGGGDEIVGHAWEDIGVAVPVGELAVVDLVVDVDEADAGFDEAAGEEKGLAECVTTVAIAESILFLRDAEGSTDGFGFEHVDGAVLIGGHRLEGVGAFLRESRSRGEVGKEFASAVESSGGDFGREREFIDLEVGEVGVARDLEGVVGCAEEACVLCGENNNVVHDVRESNVQGDGGFGGEKVMEGGSEAGEIDEGVVGKEFEISFDGGATTEGFDDGGVVIGHRMMNAANDGHAVHPARGLGKEFSDMDARGRGGDGLVDAADLLGGIGLHVPEVEMTGSAVIEEEDAGADGR